MDLRNRRNKVFDHVATLLSADEALLDGMADTADDLTGGQMRHPRVWSVLTFLSGVGTQSILHVGRDLRKRLHVNR